MSPLLPGEWRSVCKKSVKLLPGTLQHFLSFFVTTFARAFRFCIMQSIIQKPSGQKLDKHKQKRARINLALPPRRDSLPGEIVGNLDRQSLHIHHPTDLRFGEGSEEVIDNLPEGLVELGGQGPRGPTLASGLRPESITDTLREEGDVILAESPGASQKEGDNLFQGDGHRGDLHGVRTDGDLSGHLEDEVHGERTRGQGIPRSLGRRTLYNLGDNRSHQIPTGHDNLPSGTRRRYARGDSLPHTVSIRWSYFRFLFFSQAFAQRVETHLQKSVKLLPKTLQHFLSFYVTTFARKVGTCL